MHHVQDKPERQALMLHLRKLCATAGIPPTKTIAGLVAYLAGRPMTHGQALDWLAADMAANPPVLRREARKPEPAPVAAPNGRRGRKAKRKAAEKAAQAERSREGHRRKLARDAAFIAQAEKRMLKHRGEKPAPPKKTGKQRRWTFYKSAAWLALRAKVYEKYHGKCCLCGRSHRDDGVKIHADHIKPRSTHPLLELVEDNIQLLCEDCNLGKSNRYETDWRPKPSCPSPAEPNSGHSSSAARASPHRGEASG